MPKRAIREELLARRRHNSAETCLALSLEIQERFLVSEFFLKAECLVLYSAICNEVVTEAVARQALSARKRLLYPRVAGETLEFVEVNELRSLAPGSFGVLEPQGASLVSAEQIDVVLVPGVAFDQAGHRLGYGKGFYDRAMAECSAHTVRVGFAYDFQIVDALPVDEHDRPVSALMTESRTLHFDLPSGVCR